MSVSKFPNDTVIGFNLRKEPSLGSDVIIICTRNLRQGRYYLQENQKTNRVLHKLWVCGYYNLSHLFDFSTYLQVMLWNVYGTTYEILQKKEREKETPRNAKTEREV